MNFKRYFLKKSFSTMLTAVIVGVSVLAYATVTIPYTFTAGTTASSSEVNANFTALADAMPAIKTAYLADYANITEIPTQIHSIQITPPVASGKILIIALGSACIYNHTQGPRQGIGIKLTDISGDIVDGEGTQVFNVSATSPTYAVGGWDRECVPYNVSRVIPVTSTGPITFYLNSAVLSTNTTYPTGRLVGNNLIAQYIPNALP